jgi:hypothetical protein
LPSANVLAAHELVLFEQVIDDLEIHAARQIDGTLVPARETFLLAQVCGVVD